METQRALDSPSGRYVRAKLYDTRMNRSLQYQAFVPAPLPPALPLDTELVGALSEADRALGRLAGMARPGTNPYLLIRPFVRREAWLSSRIEGTQADIKDLYVYEAGQLELPGTGRKRPPSDVREIANYVRALGYGLEQVGHRPVSLSLIREMHQILLTDVRGQDRHPGAFREEQNWIGRENSPVTEARFVPPPPIELGDSLNRLEEYIRNERGYPHSCASASYTTSSKPSTRLWTATDDWVACLSRCCWHGGDCWNSRSCT